jgi:MarR family transcriptional regulator for hemolysin
MVRVIDEMDRDGLIRREGNPDDKRSKLLYLTPRGEELIARIQPILDQERSEVLSLLNDDELRTCAELLEKIFVASLSGSPPNQAQGR